MKRWRFEFHASYEEPQYVDAETEEQAWAVFRKNWDGYIESAKAAERDNIDEIPRIDDKTKIREVGLEALKWSPRPTCCDQINKIERFRDGPIISLNVSRYNETTGDYFSLIDPHWVIRKTGDEISFCPFCGTKLPEVERMEEPPQPLWDGDDDYCGTCDERNMCCECNPPWAAYRIKK